jgi:hypothetical protein
MQFEPSTGEISVIGAGCEYRRSLYSTSLGLCIIVVIFILTGIVLRKSVDTANSTLTAKSDMAERTF